MEGETNPGGDFDVPTGSQVEMDVEQAEKSPIYFKKSANELTGKNGRDGDDDDGGDDDDEAAQEGEAGAVEKPACCRFDHDVLDPFYKREGGKKTGNTGSTDGTGRPTATHALIVQLFNLGFLGDGKRRTLCMDMGSGTGVFGGHLATFPGANVAVLGVETIPERVRVANDTLVKLPPRHQELAKYLF